MKVMAIFRTSFTARILSVATMGVLTAGACAGTDNVKTPELLVQEGACIENIEKGDYDRAETRCDLCLEYNSQSAECLNGLGLIWYIRGVEEKARDYFKKAIRMNNDFSQAWNNLGTLDFSNRDFKKAAYNFERSIEINPRYLDGRYNLALAHLRMGELRRASAYTNETEAVAKSGKKVDPDTVWFNIDDSDREYILDHYKSAEKEYRKIFELYPNHVNSYRDMGLIMTYRAQLQQVENKRRTLIGDAEQFFVRCLDLNPTQEECHESVGHVFLAVGRFDEALFHHVQCLAANKNNPICGNEIKASYAGSQIKGEAMTEYVSQITENPGYAPGHYGFCLALFERELTEMAVTECQNALNIDDTICLAHYQLALHFKAVLDRNKALEHARGLLACAQDDPKYSSEILQSKEIVQALEAE